MAGNGQLSRRTDCTHRSPCSARGWPSPQQTAPGAHRRCCRYPRPPGTTAAADAASRKCVATPRMLSECRVRGRPGEAQLAAAGVPSRPGLPGGAVPAGLVRVTVAAWANDPSLDTTEACVVAEFDPADPGFPPCHQHPLLADAASLVLGDPWHVRSLDLRAPIPGAGEQGLHPDYAERRTEGPWQTLSALRVPPSR